MAGRHDEGRPDRLLAEELVHDPVLHPLHDRFAEEADHGRVDPGRHQAERVSGGDEAVVRVEILEPPADDADAREALESTTEGVAHRFFGVDQPEGLGHRSSPLESPVQEPARATNGCKKAPAGTGPTADPSGSSGSAPDRVGPGPTDRRQSRLLQRTGPGPSVEGALLPTGSGPDRRCLLAPTRASERAASPRPYDIRSLVALDYQMTISTSSGGGPDKERRAAAKRAMENPRDGPTPMSGPSRRDRHGQGLAIIAAVVV